MRLCCRAAAPRRHRRRTIAPPRSRACCRRSGLAFLLVAAAFAAYAFVPSALSAHLLAIFGRAGIDAATVVMIGALFGPAQVAARLTEFVFGRNLHPLIDRRAFAVALLVAAFALLALLGISRAASPPPSR